MKVFFDTNIYNHLSDEQTKFLLKAKNKGVIEIFCIPQILGEIASVFHTSEERGKQIIEIFEKLISEHVINQPPDLLANDLECLLTQKRNSIYLNKESKEKFLFYVDKFKKGIVDEYTQKFIRHAKNKKKENLQSLKASHKELNPLWKNHKEKFKTFDDFLQGAAQRGLIREEIKEYLHRLNARNISKLAKKIENSLDKSPYLQTAVKLTAAISYRYEISGKKPKWGDLNDITILISLVSIQIFVSDDEGAREMFDLLFPEKKSMDLSQFIDFLGEL